MAEMNFDAFVVLPQKVVPNEKYSLYVLLTKAGRNAATMARLKSLTEAVDGGLVMAHQEIEPGIRCSSLVGFTCPGEELRLNAWVLADLVHHHFGINVDVIDPTSMYEPIPPRSKLH